MSSKGGIIIENNVLKLKKLVESEDKVIMKKILNDILDLRIKQIEYDTNLQLSNISEYEFELVKVKAILETDDEVEMYLKMIKNTKIKESIFCYWCSIYEEELMKAKELEAVILCHEIDHLDGILFLDKAYDVYKLSDEEIEAAKREAEELERKEQEKAKKNKKCKRK